MTSGIFDHPWLGALFGDAEMRAIWSPERTLRHMLDFEAAFSRALGETGLADPDAARRAAAAITGASIDVADLAGGMARDGVPVPALVRQLKQAAGADSGAVHDGATSQDVVDTALALTLRDTTALLLARLARLEAAFSGLAAAQGGRELMAWTRMQAAIPFRAADRIAAWQAPLAAHRNRLARASAAVARVQLGGAVGNRAALGEKGAAVSAILARDLGLADADRAWHTDRSAVADHAGILSLVSGALGKFGQDVCLMAQQGIDAVDLAGGGGSSAMPHKKNPVPAELLVTLARFNAVQISGLHHCLVHENERSGAAWSLEWMILPPMAQATARGLEAAAQLSERISRIGGAGEP